MVQLPPPVVHFAGPPPTVDEICASITRTIGSPVRVTQDAPEQGSTYFRGRIAFACVPESAVAIWEFPPGYEKRKNIADSIEPNTEVPVDWEVADALPDVTEAWTIILVHHGVSDDTLIDAAIVVLEELGGESKWTMDDEIRRAASRPRNEAEVRRAYRKARSASRFLMAALVLYGAGLLLIMAIVAIPVGLYRLAEYCVGAVREGYRSS